MQQDPCRRTIFNYVIGRKLASVAGYSSPNYCFNAKRFLQNDKGGISTEPVLCPRARAFASHIKCSIYTNRPLGLFLYYGTFARKWEYIERLQVFRFQACVFGDAG